VRGLGRSAAYYEEAKSELPVFIASRATAAAIDEQEDVGTLAVTLKEQKQLEGAQLRRRQALSVSLPERHGKDAGPEGRDA
jgi:hypothetical protein